MMLTLFRSLLPSWRFFAEVTEIPVLEVREVRANNENSEWRAVTRQLTPAWHTPLFNSSGNMAMAIQSLLEFFQQEIEAGRDSLPGSTSYQLICAFASSQVHAAERFQFRICVLYQGASVSEAREIFVSGVETVQ